MTLERMVKNLCLSPITKLKEIIVMVVCSINASNLIIFLDSILNLLL